MRLLAAIRRADNAVVEAERAFRRTDNRAWAVTRRERTRHLIELGGLVQKAGLVDLTDDDRAAIYGALLELVRRARNGDAEREIALWRRRGKRAFDAEGAEV